MRRRPDWSRQLPRPLVIPKVMTMRTLADVWALIARMPKEFRDKSTWQYVIAQLSAAARGADPVDVAVALQIVLSLERVECRPK